MRYFWGAHDHAQVQKVCFETKTSKYWLMPNIPRIFFHHKSRPPVRISGKKLRH